MTTIVRLWSGTGVSWSILGSGLGGHTTLTARFTRASATSDSGRTASSATTTTAQSADPLYVA
jgi:hypothetical protein